MGGVHPFGLLVEQCSVRRIVERAEHARHVSQRRTLNPSLAEWTRRFALEVDDDEIFPGIEHLSQMVVAVAANAHGRNFSPEDRLETPEDVLFVLKDSLGISAHCLWQLFEAPAQEWKGPRGVAAH